MVLDVLVREVAAQSGWGAELVGLAVSGGLGAIFMAVMRGVVKRRDEQAFTAAVSALDASEPEGAAAASEDSPGLAMFIAPAPPLPEAITRVRELLGETSPPPRITRYTRLIVAVDERALRITDKDVGVFLTVPAADISSIWSEPALIHPKGTILARIFPSVHVTVRRDGELQVLSLAPITGMYDKLKPVHVDGIAVAFSDVLGVPLVSPEAPPG